MREEILAGRYRIGEKTFSGRGWSSYLALDTHLGVEVELDIVSTSAEDLPIPLERFREILRAAKAIRGPHALPLLEWVEEGENLYLVREKEEGTPLAELSTQLGTLPPPQVVDLVRAVVEVMAEAYGVGLYYLGLNPSQVLVDPRGNPRLRQVGYAWVLEDMDPSQAARVSSYRAPEAGRGEEGARTSDVFSLAVMINQLLPEEPRSVRLELLLEKATDPLPSRRPSSPRLLLEELEASLEFSMENGRSALPEEELLPGREITPGRWDTGEPGEGGEEGRASNPGLTVLARERHTGRRWRKLAFMLAGGLALWVIFSAVSGFIGARKEGGQEAQEETTEVGVELPDLQGLSLSEARECLEELGLGWSVREAPSRLWSAGRVVAQEPAAGSWLEPGEEVRLVVSSGREELEVVPGGEEGVPTDQVAPMEPEADSAVPSPSISAQPVTSPSTGALSASPRAPRAVASLSTLRGAAPLYVRMYAGKSWDPDGDITGYTWHCGDGTVLFGQTVQHVYDPLVIPARFQVVLEVTDSRGLSDSAVVTVEVY